MIVKNTKDNTIRKLEIPDDVPFSFYDQQLIFEEGIEHIEITDYSQFRKDVVFPSTVKTINIDALKRSNISYIIVNSGNARYSHLSGILYSQDKRDLYCVPKNYAPAIVQIPPETQFVAPNAFKDCKCIIHVTFTGTVHINKHAFYNSLVYQVSFQEDAFISKEAFIFCTNLDRVISRGKKFSVERQAFSVCDSLSAIETEAGEFIVPLSDDFEIKIKESKIV